jgi:hypothetical protein
MNPADLQDLVHRELRRLHEPEAPETLLPRVMARVRIWSGRPWYERAWSTWPRGWQCAAAAAWIAVAMGAAWLLPRSAEAAGDIAALVSTMTADALDPRLTAAAAAARLVWRTLVAPALPYALAVAALMGFACTLLGAALDHVAFRRMAPR